MATRYNADQNKLLMRFESGTYAVPLAPGRWIGEVMDSSVTDEEGYLRDIFLGDATRSVGRFDQGPKDLTGTITYKPVDMNLVFHNIGSVFESSGTTFSHTATEVGTDVVQNPFTSGTNKDLNVPYSFTLEDSKQAPGTGKNFVRTSRGCIISTLTLNATQGEKVTIDADWIGQQLIFSSGTTTAVTVASQTPYLWSDCSLTLGANTVDTGKDISIEFNQNVEGPHYINGSREIGDPYFGTREYTLTVTADMDAAVAKSLYNDFYKGGSDINWQFDMNADVTATGSAHATFTVSGAKVTAMDIPSPAEGINEYTITVSAGSMNAADFTNPSQIGSYNPF